MHAYGGIFNHNGHKGFFTMDTMAGNTFSLLRLPFEGHNVFASQTLLQTRRRDCPELVQGRALCPSNAKNKANALCPL